MRFILPVTLFFLLTVGCTPGEKTIEVRQADPNIRQSFSQANRNTLTIKKSALQKTFLLVANSKSTGEQPTWTEHPVKIVSFKIAGSKVGLFEVGYSQIYKTLNTHKVLQTFDVVSTAEDSVEIDVESGFKIVEFDQGFEIMSSSAEADSMKKSGIELSRKLTDAFVTKAEFSENKLYINQASRFRISQPQQGEAELSLDSTIEIIPYSANSSFVPKEQDEDWAVGAFLTRILFDESSRHKELALRWNLSSGRAIRYILTANTPKEVIPIIKEGLEYWNIVAGKTILTVEVSDQQDLAPIDGAVIVRWIPYKDAGMAYAGMQSNPVTGEILRGHIYLPSFWINSDYFEKKYEGLDQRSHFASNACGIELGSKKDFQQLLQQAPTFGVKKAMYDYLRLVVAHESGHTLGLRHNFAGSSVTNAPFELIQMAHQNYAKDPTGLREYPELSVSVMDYTTALDSAILGVRIQTKPLSYDADYVAWAYKGQEKPKSAKAHFCTDDHLMYSAKEKVSILGCEAAESAGSPLMSVLQLQAESDEQSLKYDLDALLKLTVKADGQVVNPQLDYFFSVGQYMIQFNLAANKLSNYMFAANNKKNNREQNIILSRSDTTAAVLGLLGTPSSTSSQAESELAKEFQSLLKNPSLAYLLLPVDQTGALDIAWNESALQKINLANYKSGKTQDGFSYKMSDDEFEKFIINAKLVTRTVAKAKLVLAPQRLLISKTGLESKLSKYVPEEGATFSYRSWLDKRDLQGRLKPYMSQLIRASFGMKKLMLSGGQEVEVPDYIVNQKDIEAIHAGLTESSLMLGLDRDDLAFYRSSHVREVLQSLGLDLDIRKSFDQQIEDLNLLKTVGKLSFDLHAWANSEILFSKYLKETALNL